MKDYKSNYLRIRKSFLLGPLMMGLFLSLTIDMGGEFGLRNILFPIFGLALIQLLGVKLPKEWLFPFSILVVYPALMLLLGVLRGGELPTALSQYQSTVLGFLIYVLIAQLPLEEATAALVNSMFLVASLAVAMAVGLVFGLDAISGLLLRMAEKGGGYFGERNVGEQELIPNVYFKSTLFYVPTFILAVFAKRFTVAAVCFMALIAAVSKTGMIVAGFFGMVFVYKQVKVGGRTIGAISLILVLLFVYQSPMFNLFSEILVNDSSTVNVRSGHLESLLRVWANNPANFVSGFGLGTAFYSSGAGMVVSNIEIDHFNVVRKYGFIWALIFFGWVLKVCYVAINSRERSVQGLGWGLLLIFIVAGTNPVLISPLFFVFFFLTLAATRRIDYVVRGN